MQEHVGKLYETCRSLDLEKKNVQELCRKVQEVWTLKKNHVGSCMKSVGIQNLEKKGCRNCVGKCRKWDFEKNVGVLTQKKKRCRNVYESIGIKQTLLH